MFREIRIAERITDQDRRREERQKELDNIQRIAGRHYTQQEFDEARLFLENLFKR